MDGNCTGNPKKSWFSGRIRGTGGAFGSKSSMLKVLFSVFAFPDKDWPSPLKVEGVDASLTNLAYSNFLAIDPAPALLFTDDGLIGLLDGSVD